MIEKNAETGLFEAVIDERKYEFQKWGAEDSLSVLLTLAKIAGKPLGSAFAAASESKDETLFDKKMDMTTVIPMILESLTERLDEKIVIPIIKKLASGNVFCDGVKIESFSKHYEDRLDHLFRVVKTALEVQYGNFFAALLGSVGISKTSQTRINRVV